jgi:hypothetical protein
MSYYAIPLYIGLSCILSLIYSSIEFIKDKGKLDTAVSSILCTWVIVTIIVTSIISGVVSEMMMGVTNYLHLLIGLILACVTLSISSSLLYWS